jgi:guanosine-3',5'-bis(diphosphate) 3'-pyrophosphohydrolase
MEINHGEHQPLVDTLRRRLLQTARQNMHGKAIETIDLAFQVANHAHLGQFRKSSEPYITHPIEVATFIAEWGLDEQTIAGALMHDVIEDTPVTKEELVRIFGPSIAELVDSVTKLDKLHFESEEAAHAEYFRKVVLAMAKDVRVILIKLADRMHNMLTLGSMRPDKQRRIALETMEIYVPIADKIGLHKVHLELAEESFKYIYPYRYRILSAAAEVAHQNRLPIIQGLMSNIDGALKSNGIKGEFKYRQRTIHNLYSRMLKRQQSFDRIYDIFEVKVIVETIGNCYLTLGVIHNLYQPVPGKFKDYIAIPKSNGYQSLHSTMMGPNGTPIQIHIRTREMEEIAEQGIISHWLKQQTDNIDNQAKTQTSTWLNNILDIQSSTFSATEFLESIKKDLSPKDIYVFTPRGKIIHLPQGSTPLDFAYTIHTDIGNHFHKARVNQRPVTINQSLQNGDVIEVITTIDSEPDPEWLNYAISGRAISKIKQYLKEQKYDEDISNGVRLLGLALHLSESELIADDETLQALIKRNYKRLTLADFEQKIGVNEIPVLKVVKELLNIAEDEPVQIKLSNCNLPIIQDDACCPLPHETILAKITRKGELELHRSSCTKNRAIGLDKLIPVTILNDTKMEFLSKLSITIDNLPGTFNKLSSIIAERQINMEEIFQERRENHALVVVRLTITTHSAKEIDDLLTSVAEHDFIIKAVRI